MSPLLNDWDRQVYRESAQGQYVWHKNTYILFILKDMLQETGEKQHMHKMDRHRNGASDNRFYFSIFEE